MSPFRNNASGKFLIPAHNSRHRTACLALYRAFLRLAPQVSLPDDLATGWGNGKNPIAIQIRNAFRRNKADISPRIIYPAMSAGYRMLKVLHEAATSPASAHSTSVITFLQTRLKERQRSLANYVPPPPKPDVPRPGTIPLLVNVTPAPTPSNPTPQIEYATPSRPRPLSELGGSGRRQIPVLDMSADLPFLRLTKPQPKLLSRVLRQKLARRVERGLKLQQFADEVLTDARLEDKWDTMMADLQRTKLKSGSPRPRAYGVADHDHDHNHDYDYDYDDGDMETYAQTVQQHGVTHMVMLLENERIDLVARADAMRRLVAQETALAAEEKVQNQAERRAQWEARMLARHGEGWRDLFPKLKESDKHHDEKLKALREKTAVVSL